MRQVTLDLIEAFQPTSLDWMGYEFRNIRELNFHHIQKKEHGGKYSFDNGALLCGDTAHQYIHVIEYKDLDMYLYINALLKGVNTQGYRPTKNQLLAIKSVLEQFEREHSGDRTNKGKPLIKPKYVERRHTFR